MLLQSLSIKKLEGLDVFSVIRLDGEVIFFTGRFLQVFYFSSTAVAKTENLEQGFLRNFFSNFELPVIRNCNTISLHISCRR